MSGMTSVNSGVLFWLWLQKSPFQSKNESVKEFQCHR